MTSPSTTRQFMQCVASPTALIPLLPGKLPGVQTALIRMWKVMLGHQGSSIARVSVTQMRLLSVQAKEEDSQLCKRFTIIAQRVLDVCTIISSYGRQTKVIPEKAFQNNHFLCETKNRRLASLEILVKLNILTFTSLSCMTWVCVESRVHRLLRQQQHRAKLRVRRLVLYSETTGVLTSR